MTPDKPGDVDLHGRIHQTAPLEIAGQGQYTGGGPFSSTSRRARAISSFRR